MGVLAAAAAAVSWQAQYMMVWRVKQAIWVAALEAGIPDIGAVVFAALGIALALHGRRAVRPRALNAACIGISLAMNALAAGHGWRDLAIWVMPVRAVRAGVGHADRRGPRLGAGPRPRSGRDAGRGRADPAVDGGRPGAVAAAAGAGCRRRRWRGFRDWVVTDCPVAPGLRPGHVAQLEAERRAADEQVTLAIGQRDDAVGRAAAQAEQARGEADRARAAEAEVRGELDRVRADARQAVTQALADAAREREELRGLGRTAGRQHARRACAGPRRCRSPGRSRSATTLRPGSPPWKPTAQGCARNGTGWPQTFAPPPASRGRHRSPARGGRAQRARRDGPAKRDRMIELAGQRRDLAAMPLAEVSKLASAVAAEIGYSPGTARRELVRHVRELQAAPRDNQAGGGRQ